MDRRSSLGQTWMTVLLIASLWFTSRSNKTSDPSMQELLYAGTVVADLREFHRGFMRSLLHSPLKGTTVHDGLIGGWRRGWESNPRARFCQATRFRGGLFRPLRHLSAVAEPFERRR